MLIKKQKEMTESEKIAVDNSNNQYLQALSYVAVGTIYPYAGGTPPETFMFCDGTQLDIDEYVELFGVIGYKFGGSGDKFNLPTKNMLPNSSLNYIIKTMQDDVSGKVVLQKGTEVVFLGGDARSSVQVELAIDDEPSPNSDNPVKSSGIYKEVNKHNKQIETIADYIVEQGEKDGWTYRKLNSGIAECWMRTTGQVIIDGSWSTDIPMYYKLIGNFEYPITFTEIPKVFVDLEAQDSWDNKYPAKINETGNIYAISPIKNSVQEYTLNIEVKGTWK